MPLLTTQYCLTNPDPQPTPADGTILHFVPDADSEHFVEFAQDCSTYLPLRRWHELEQALAEVGVDTIRQNVPVMITYVAALGHYVLAGLPANKDLNEWHEISADLVMSGGSGKFHYKTVGGGGKTVNLTQPPRKDSVFEMHNGDSTGLVTIKTFTGAVPVVSKGVPVLADVVLRPGDYLKMVGTEAGQWRIIIYGVNSPAGGGDFPEAPAVDSAHGRNGLTGNWEVVVDLTRAQSIAGEKTFTEAFTSPGINDDATAERLQVLNAILLVGDDFSVNQIFPIGHPTASGSIKYGGGGLAGLTVFGNRSGQEGDLLFEDDTGDPILEWDENAGYWNFRGTVMTNVSASIRLITDAADDIVTSDNGKILVCDRATAIALSLPDTLAVNFQCTIVQVGVGVPTVTPDTDTINGAGAGVAPIAQWKGMYLSQYSDTNWLALL